MSFAECPPPGASTRSAGSLAARPRPRPFIFLCSTVRQPFPSLESWWTGREPSGSRPGPTAGQCQPGHAWSSHRAGLPRSAPARAAGSMRVPRRGAQLEPSTLDCPGWPALSSKEGWGCLSGRRASATGPHGGFQRESRCWLGPEPGYPSPAPRSWQGPWPVGCLCLELLAGGLGGGWLPGAARLCHCGGNCEVPLLCIPLGLCVNSLVRVENAVGGAAGVMRLRQNAALSWGQAPAPVPPGGDVVWAADGLLRPVGSAPRVSLPPTLGAL